jgi:hypothetical protein
MKKHSMKTVLEAVYKELEWPIIEQLHQMPMVRIVSNPRTKTHIILKPDELHKQSSDSNFLHELGHARLCEKIHPVFSANTSFAPHENKRQFLVVIPALNAACDWFIGQWQLGICPQVTKEQFRENLSIAEEILEESKLPPIDIILDAGMVIAQSIHYLEEPIDCDGVLKKIVDAFLSVPPEKPSADNCVLLVNLLMATYTDQRASLINDGEFFVWHIQPAAGIDKPNAATAEIQGLNV